MENMNIDQIIKLLDQSLTEKWASYVDLRTLLNTYSGRPLTEAEAKDVASIFTAIEETFLEIYPAINLIVYRHQWATNAIGGHNDWIEMLRKANLIKTESKKENMA